MAACLKVETWRVSTRTEIAEFLKDSKTPEERKRETLAVRAKLGRMIYFLPLMTTVSSQSRQAKKRRH